MIHPSGARAAVGVGLLALMLYLPGLAPGLTWGDSAKLAAASKPLVVVPDAGYHTLRNIFGSWANALPGPWSVPLRQNAVSAFFGALAAAWMVRLVLACAGPGLCTARPRETVLGGVFAGSALAVSHLHWHLSEITESYTLTTWLLLVAMDSVIRACDTGRASHALAGGLAAGLGTLNFIPFAAWILLWGGWLAWAPSGGGVPRRWGVFAVGALAGLLPLALLSASAARQFGSSQALARVFDWGYARESIFTHPARLVTSGWQFPALLLYQFPSPAILLLWPGVRRLFTERRSALLLLLIWILGLWVFSSGYMEQRRFYLMAPAFALCAALIGAGASAALDWTGHPVRGRWLLAGTLVLPVLAYVIAPGLAARFIAPERIARRLPCRENAVFFLRPWKKACTGPEAYAAEVWRLTRAGDTVIVDFTPGTILWGEQQLLARGRDVQILDSASQQYADPSAAVRERLKIGRVFLADTVPAYKTGRLKAEFELVGVGPLTEVRPRKK